METNAMQLYLRLMEYLSVAVDDNCKNGMMLRIERFHGVFPPGEWVKESGLTVEQVYLQMSAIDFWSDFNKLPSLTSLMRPAPKLLDDLTVADVYTYLRHTSTKPINVQRQLLNITKKEGVVSLSFNEEKTTLTGKVAYLITTGEVPDPGANVIERDRVVNLYGRLGKVIPSN